MPSRFCCRSHVEMYLSVMPWVSALQDTRNQQLLYMHALMSHTYCLQHTLECPYSSTWEAQGRSLLCQ